MIASKTWVRTIALALSLASAGTPAAAQTSYVARLSGANENPVNASPGFGFGFFTLSSDRTSLAMNISFSGLLGLTTASHIHCCAIPPANALVATTTPTFAGFPLGVTSGLYVTTLDLTLASSYNPAFITANGGTISTAQTALINGFNNGTTYLNIHTSSFPGGEIRGTITGVPEPSAVLLMGSGLLALGVVARRKSRQL